MSVDVLPFALVDAMLDAEMMAAFDRGPATRLMEARDRLGAWRALWWRTA